MDNWLSHKLAPHKQANQKSEDRQFLTAAGSQWKGRRKWEGCAERALICDVGCVWKNKFHRLARGCIHLFISICSYICLSFHQPAFSLYNHILFTATHQLCTPSPSSPSFIPLKNKNHTTVHHLCLYVLMAIYPSAHPFIHSFIYLPCTTPWSSPFLPPVHMQQHFYSSIRPLNQSSIHPKTIWVALSFHLLISQPNHQNKCWQCLFLPLYFLRFNVCILCCDNTVLMVELGLGPKTNWLGLPGSFTTNTAGDCLGISSNISIRVAKDMTGKCPDVPSKTQIKC